MHPRSLETTAAGAAVATGKISADTVRADFNDPVAVVHYARAAHFLGLWRSEHELIAKHIPDLGTRILEAGCGAGRGAVGLWTLGYRDVHAFDFAEELVEQARHLAQARGASGIVWHHADATALAACAPLLRAAPFGAALFLFNGLMQIPGRARRRQALRNLAALCRPDAPLLFTSHDRNSSPRERELWRAEKERWNAGTQDPRLVEFGDRYFEDEAGRTFMHLPEREEILEDLAATGWRPVFDAMRSEVAAEPRSVREFSDECRFWVARRCP